MPYKRPLGWRQAFGIKNKIAKNQGNHFFTSSRRDWNFLGNAGRKRQGSFILAESLAAFLTKYQSRLDNQTPYTPEQPRNYEEVC
jgi:hypothetical protein